MPDDWELINGFDYKSASDGSADADGDGLTNAEEAAAGTDPYIEDSDGDSQSDVHEVRFGSDPLNPFETVVSVRTASPWLWVAGACVALLMGVMRLRQNNLSM
jgi:hypothetical protein